MTEENVGRGEVMLMTRVSVIQRCNLYINAKMKRTYNTVLPKLLGEVCHWSFSESTSVSDVSSLYHFDNCDVTQSLHPDLREYRVYVKRENA
jgi:hypothetical protein